MTNYNDTFSVLTGGGADSLDGIAVATLSDGDFAFGMINGLYHPYHYVAASAESEASPYFIIPNDNVSGTGVWVLGGFKGAMSHVEAETDAGQSIPNGADTEVIFEDEIEDDLDEYSISTGRFTAIYAGYYDVKALITTDSASWPAGLILCRCSLRKNGVEYRRGFQYLPDKTVAGPGISSINTTIKLAAADYISIYFWHNQGASLNLSSNAKNTYLTIDRVA